MSSEGAVTKAMEKVSTGRAVLLEVVLVAMLVSRRIRGNTWTALYTFSLHTTPENCTDTRPRHFFLYRICGSVRVIRCRLRHV